MYTYTFYFGRGDLLQILLISHARGLFIFKDLYTNVAFIQAVLIFSSNSYVAFLAKFQ